MIKGYVAHFERCVNTVEGVYKNANKFDGMARYYQEDVESYTCDYKMYGIQAETLEDAEAKLRKFCEEKDYFFLGVRIDNESGDPECEIDLYDETFDLTNEYDEVDYRKDPDDFKVSLEDAIKWLG